jgi:hypothetical protein
MKHNAGLGGLDTPTKANKPHGSTRQGQAAAQPKPRLEEEKITNQKSNVWTCTSHASHKEDTMTWMKQRNDHRQGQDTARVGVTGVVLSSK